MRTHHAILLIVLALAPQAAAQAPQPKAAEVEELKALLGKLDAAIAKHAALLDPAVTLEVTDVRGLLVAHPPDRAAPRMSVDSAAAGFQTARGGGGGSFAFDCFEEPDGSVLDPDKLQELLVQAVGEERWEEPCSIELHRGSLIVRQTAVGHERIRRALTSLQADTWTAVQLEVGFWSLSADLREGLRRAALENDGVLPAASLAALDAAAGKGAKQLGATVVSALDGQRVYLHQGSERAYVAEVSQSSGGGTGKDEWVAVADPIVRVLRSGVTVDARPTLVRDGEREVVHLDVRFARCRITGGAQKPTPWGPIDCPQVETDTVRTSARVQAGGGMLVYAAEGGADVGDDVTIVVRPRITRK
jgi:hypothetical protein